MGQDSNEAGKWHALPYELAHAVVRIVAMHGKAFSDAKAEYESLKESDPAEAKPKTVKAKESFEGLRKVDRYTVMNRRTGWVATADWMARSIAVGPGGVPKLKKEGSKASPWILTVRLHILNQMLSIWLRPAAGKPFRSIRCIGLRDGNLKAKFTTLVAGYEHMLENVTCCQSCTVYCMFCVKEHNCTVLYCNCSFSQYLSSWSSCSMLVEWCSSVHVVMSSTSTM